MSRITGLGCITAGEIWLDYADIFESKLPRWEGEAIVLELRKVGKRQSDAARGYYRAAVLPVISAHMREEGDLTATDDDAHEALGHLFLALPPTKMGTPRRRSTSPEEMADEEFKEFLDKAILFGRADLHLDIPDAERDPARRLWTRRRPT